MTEIHNVWAIANDWQRASLVALALATVVQTLFVVIYASRPWWKARVGRALMLKSAALCVVLWLTIVNTFYVYAGEEAIGTVALWVVAIAITYQFVVLLWSPRHPER